MQGAQLESCNFYRPDSLTHELSYVYATHLLISDSATVFVLGFSRISNPSVWGSQRDSRLRGSDLQLAVAPTTYRTYDVGPLPIHRRELCLWAAS